MLRRLRDVALVSFLAYALVMVTLPSAAFLAHTAPDDAYYYLAIARRFGEHPWPTFDGVHVTTGFHPLWLFVLLPFARTIGDPLLLARVAVLLGGLLSAVAALLLGRFVAEEIDEDAGDAAAVMLLGSAGFARFGLQAMETPLSMVLAAAFLLALRRDARPWVLGLLAALVVLARLDMAILVLVGFAWQARTRAIPWKAGAIAAFAFTPYAAWNLALTGQVQTTSSAVKAWVVAHDAQSRFGGRFTLGFAREALGAATAAVVEVARGVVGGLLAGPLAVFGGEYPSMVSGARVLLLSALTSGVALVIAFRLAPRARAVRLPPVVAVPVVAALLHLLASSLLITGQAGPWYWGLAWLSIAVLAAWARSRLVHAALMAQVVSLAVLSLSLLGLRGGGSFAARRSFSGTLFDLRAQVAAAVPDGARAGACNAGTLGFFGAVPMLNLDGLVSDPGFLAARRRGALRRWMRDERLAVVADCVPRAGQTAYLAQLGLSWEDVEVLTRTDARTCEAFVFRVHP